MEATHLEKNSGEKQTAAERQEIPKQEATVKTVRALKKLHGDRHLTIERRQPRAVVGPGRNLPPTAEG
jgi:hypothetical protein